MSLVLISFIIFCISLWALSSSLGSRGVRISQPSGDQDVDQDVDQDEARDEELPHKKHVTFKLPQECEGCASKQSGGEATPVSDPTPTSTSAPSATEFAQQLMKEEPKMIAPPFTTDTLFADADFKSERTNIGAFFESNKDVFSDSQRHNTFVPDVDSWNNKFTSGDGGAGSGAGSAGAGGAGAGGGELVPINSFELTSTYY
jgi:hypothetical protein